MERRDSYSINYGNKIIDFSLLRSNRKTMGITVHPNLDVVVTAPEQAGMEKILDKVGKKGRWIVRQQRYFKSFLPQNPPREYVSGETHLYLGKQYKLKIIRAKHNQVKLIRGKLEVRCNSGRIPEHVKNLLSSWYKSHAEYRFNKSLKDQITLFNGQLNELPNLEIKRMSRRWGSCTPKGKIVINPEIIKAPSRCIDYVILHELCHLVHHNHGKEFYQLQERLMPDWKKWKERLERG